MDDEMQNLLGLGARPGSWKRMETYLMNLEGDAEMTFLIRCDNPDCQETVEVELAGFTAGTGAGRPVRPKHWFWGPYGDFCTEQCETAVINAVEAR